MKKEEISHDKFAERFELNIDDVHESLGLESEREKKYQEISNNLDALVPWLKQQRDSLPPAFKTKCDRRIKELYAIALSQPMTIERIREIKKLGSFDGSINEALDGRILESEEKTNADCISILKHQNLNYKHWFKAAMVLIEKAEASNEQLKEIRSKLFGFYDTHKDMAKSVSEGIVALLTKRANEEFESSKNVTRRLEIINEGYVHLVSCNNFFATNFREEPDVMKKVTWLKILDNDDLDQKLRAELICSFKSIVEMKKVEAESFRHKTFFGLKVLTYREKAITHLISIASSFAEMQHVKASLEWATHYNSPAEHKLYWKMFEYAKTDEQIKVLLGYARNIRQYEGKSFYEQLIRALYLKVKRQEVLTIS